MGKLEDTATDLAMERNRSARLGIELMIAHRRSHELAQDLTQEKGHSANARAEVVATRQVVHSLEEAASSGQGGIARSGAGTSPNHH